MARGIEKRRFFANDKDRDQFVRRLGKLVSETRTDDDNGKITDSAGNLFNDDASREFSTRGSEDNTPLQVIITTPTNGATDIAPHASISAIFSEPMDPVSLSDSVFQLSSDQDTVSCQIAYDDRSRILAMTRDSALNAATIYTTVISDQGKDLGLNALSEPCTWQILTVYHLHIVYP
jgi:hypothetical protein